MITHVPPEDRPSAVSAAEIKAVEDSIQDYLEFSAIPHRVEAELAEMLIDQHVLIRSTG